MANNCINYVSITGSSKEIKKLAKEINTEEPYRVLSSKYRREQEDPRWFTFDNVEVYETHITINGDSEWCPALGLFTNISKKYPSIEIEYEYEEGRCDFAGVAKISKGDCDDNCQTYWKGRVEIDYDYALQSAFELLEDFESVEELEESDMFLVFNESDQKELLNTFKACVA